MFVIAIKDLEIFLSNLNLVLRNNVIWFELLAQKKKTNK